MGEIEEELEELGDELEHVEKQGYSSTVQLALWISAIGMLVGLMFFSVRGAQAAASFICFGSAVILGLGLWGARSEAAEKKSDIYEINQEMEQKEEELSQLGQEYEQLELKSAEG